MLTADKAIWRPVARVEKFAHADLDRLGLLDVDGTALRAEGVKPYEVAISEGNLLLTAGVNRLVSLLIGAGGQAYSPTFARLGVGDGTTAVTASQTDLAGPNKFFKACDNGFPNGSTSATLTAQSTYDTNTANFAWNEWGIDPGGGGTSASNAVVVAPLLNRKVPSPSLGTKASGVWVLTVTIAIA